MALRNSRINAIIKIALVISIHVDVCLTVDIPVSVPPLERRSGVLLEAGRG